MTLTELFLKYSSAEAGFCDKSSLHSYGEFYEKLLAPYKESAHRILEVGVRGGGSLKAWRDWFPNATIFGIDNGHEAGIWDPKGEERIKVLYADTFKPDTVDLAIRKTVRSIYESSSLEFDIVIDDGCHNVLAQAATWGMIYPFTKSIYVIEDVEGITHAINLQRHFGGVIEDRRVVKNRHDDILLYWIK